MDTKALRQKILDLAIRGKLVSQDPNDEPASVLLERIREKKQQMLEEGKLKKKDIKNDSVIYLGEDNLHYEKFQDGTVKCIEDEIPFELPEGWAWSKINTIAFVTKLAGFEYTKNIAQNLCENGIPLFKGKNVQNSTIIYEFESYIPESVSDKLQRSQITRKCILTPYVGTIGNIGIHNRPGKYHLGSNVGKIELYNSNVTILEEYVVTYLKSKYGYQQLTKHMKATAQASISMEAIRDVYLPIPPADEQQRIWNMLSRTLNLIDYIECSKLDIRELISTVKTKLLDLAIRGKLVPQNPNDEPASVLLERIRAKKEDLIKQGKIKRDKKESIIFKGEDNSYYEKIQDNVRCIDEEIPFDIPNTWTFVRLKHIGAVVGGGTPKTSNPLYWDGEIPWLTPADLSGYKAMYVSAGDRKITQEGLDSSSAQLMPTGTVLYSSRAPIGYVAIASNPLATNQGFKSIIPYEFSMSEYLYYCLKARTADIEQRATGTTFKEISGSAMAETIIPLPPVAEQQSICTKLKESLSTIERIEQVLT